jgi:hypothetical protein
VKEFLETLYKLSRFSHTQGIDELWHFMVVYFKDKKFEVIDQLFNEMDLSKLDTSLMYTSVMLASNYHKQISTYPDYYNRVREEFARRGESEDHIKELFDKLRDGGNHPYDPEAPAYKSPDKLDSEKLSKKIEEAQLSGDPEMVKYLIYYRAHLEHETEKRRKYSELRQNLGDEEVRKRAIVALRKMADLLEKSAGSWPGIYYLDLPEEPFLEKTFIDGLSVVVSYPWPG